MKEVYDSLDELDIDELDEINDALLEVTSDNKKLKKKQKQLQKKKKTTDESIEMKKSFSHILKKFVLPYTGFTVLGIFAGMILAPTPPAAKQEVVKPVKQIVGNLKLQDTIKSVKDDQIAVLQDQLAKLKETIRLKGSDDPNNQTEVEFKELANIKQMSDQYSVAKKVIDPFLNSAVVVDRYSDEKSLDAAKKSLAEFVNDPSGQKVYKFLSDKSIAKSLDENVVRAGTSFVSMLNVVPNKSVTYLVQVPVITVNTQKTLIAEYLFTLEHIENNPKILDVKYLGFNATDDIKLHFNQIKESLNQFTNTVEENKPQTENKPNESNSDENKPQTENKPEENKPNS